MKELLFAFLLTCSLPLVGEYIDNPVLLLSRLGPNGTAGLNFSFTTKVVRVLSPIDDMLLLRNGSTHFLLNINTLPSPPKAQNGDIVFVSGRTETHPYQPRYVFANCKILNIIGHEPPDPPVESTIADILNGSHPFQVIRIKGIISDVFPDDIDHKWQHLVLTQGNMSLGLAIPISRASTIATKRLIGAEVNVTSIARSFSLGYRRIFGPEITLLSLDDIQVVKPPPADPFQAPPISRIRHPQVSQIVTLGRHHIEGRVIAIWQGGHLLLRCDDNDIASVSLSDETIPAYGDYIEAVGLPETDLYHINLKRAIWRKKTCDSIFVDDIPHPSNAIEIFTDGRGHHEINPDFHGKAISLSGIVIDIPTAGCNNPCFHLKCDDYTLKVDASSTPKVIKNLTIGSTIQVSGICIVKTDSWHPNEPIPHIKEVLLAPRSPMDFKLLSHPPWWTTARLVAVIGALFLALIGFLLWNFLLHRAADRKSKELINEKVKHIESQLKVQERTRIAVELHDSIAQNLTGVSLEIDSAEQLANKNLAGMMQHLQIAARTLQSCRNELRNCLWDLRSRALEENDLNEAIRRAIAPQISEVTLTIRFNVPRTKLTDDLAHVLMRIVRELAINAVRHGNAKNVWIAGSLDGDRLLFSVRDDGSGFDPDTRPGVLQGHFGLQGIHERVNQFNGTMEIASTPGHGAKVTISLNIPDKEHA